MDRDGPVAITPRKTGVAATPVLLPPEGAKPRRRQFGIADRVLDRPVAKPILDRPRIMPRIGQSEAAGVAEHVGVYLVVKSCALANALDKPIDGVRRERSTALGREHKC